MAKDKEETVTVPASLLQQLQARLEALELAERARLERTDPRQRVEDAEWEQRKALLSRPPEVKTQELADRKYTEGQRFRVSLDATTADGKPGPNVREHFPLEINARSDLEAQARYLELMGIQRHEYRLRAEPVAA